MLLACVLAFLLLADESDGLRFTCMQGGMKETWNVPLNSDRQLWKMFFFVGCNDLWWDKTDFEWIFAFTGWIVVFCITKTETTKCPL